MNISYLLQHIYATLLHSYGPQSWWPADSPFEMMVGAILTQNTAWTNVEKAIAGLREACDLTPEGVLSLDQERLEQAIRPSGYFRQKAERLRGFCRFIADEYGRDMAGMEQVGTTELRETLLSLSGIGPETVDSMLLYALNKPVFVVDAYTVRLFSRLGLCGERANYDDVQALFMGNLAPDVKMFNEYHALIVNHSKRICTKRNPGCENCTLYEMCEWESKIQNLKSKKTP
jgi:endonuclease-3 related protein